MGREKTQRGLKNLKLVNKPVKTGPCVEHRIAGRRHSWSPLRYGVYPPHICLGSYYSETANT